MFHSTQPLNEWVKMLHAIYGGSQNYAKTPYELHAHLTEVCGIFGKNLFKRKDVKGAQEFLPKMFAWAVAILTKMHPDKRDLEEIILRKFPRACGYCLAKPCSCWSGEKPTLDVDGLRKAFYQNVSGTKRAVNDFQLMFREIYSNSWKSGAGSGSDEEVMRRMFIRLIEELAEIGEAIRFHHLYPENFENEIADFFAWWFGLVSMISQAPNSSMLAEDLLWQAYPGQCRECETLPCLCRPGPVRQLMSKPVPGHDHRFDALTSALNQAAYNEDIGQIAEGILATSPPTSCARLDVDNFKSVNDKHGHAAGDEALRHIAAIIRRTIRERDRLYRISGDEFGVLFSNFTEEEASGAMRRVCRALHSSTVRWISRQGDVHEFKVSVSIGVSEFEICAEVRAAFERADRAAYTSKAAGKATVTRARQMTDSTPMS